MSPELLSGELVLRNLIEKCDVYAFGMLVWAIFCGEEPFPDCRFGYEVVAKVVEHDARPSLSSIADIFEGAKTLRDLCASCWSRDPRRRPSFDRIATRLMSMWDRVDRERDSTSDDAVVT